MDSPDCDYAERLGTNPAPSRSNPRRTRHNPTLGIVGERGDEVSVARFIADQRTFYRVPYAVCCVILGVSQSWFYKWFNRPATAGQRRRGELDAAVLKCSTRPSVPTVRLVCMPTCSTLGGCSA